MTAVLSSITRAGRFDHELQVARGQIMGHTAVTVFGYNQDVDTVEESVWPNGGLIPYVTTAYGSSGNNSVSSMFNLILIKNDGQS